MVRRRGCSWLVGRKVKSSWVASSFPSWGARCTFVRDALACSCRQLLFIVIVNEIENLICTCCCSNCEGCAVDLENCFRSEQGNSCWGDLKSCDQLVSSCKHLRLQILHDLPCHDLIHWELLEEEFWCFITGHSGFPTGNLPAMNSECFQLKSI